MWNPFNIREIKIKNIKDAHHDPKNNAYSPDGPFMEVDLLIYFHASLDKNRHPNLCSKLTLVPDKNLLLLAQDGGKITTLFVKLMMIYHLSE